MGGNYVSSCTFQICDFILHKKSLESYNLICLGLQVNFKKGPRKFFHICIYNWFRSTMMGCAIGVHKLGSNKVGRELFFHLHFQICDFISCKKSIVGYNLIVFGFQVKLKNGLVMFFSNLHIYLV